MLCRGHFRSRALWKVFRFLPLGKRQIGKFSVTCGVSNTERTLQIPTQRGHGEEGQREADDAVPGPRPRLGLQVDRAALPAATDGGAAASSGQADCRRSLFLLLLLLDDAANGTRAAEDETRQ